MRGVFDSLSKKLQKVFRDLRGLGRISESNISESLREVRMALLDADVNFKVARDFIDKVKDKAIGMQVIQSIKPGEQVVKIIHDELVELLGSANTGLQQSRQPSCILMVGLHGSGKTTSSGKLAKLLTKQGRNVLLVAADVYRPAAMDQLETLGKQLNVPVLVQRGEKDVLKIARAALDQARVGGHNTVLFDTAGRLQIDEPLVQELVRLRDTVQPDEILLVLDAATGQEAVNVATHFDQALSVTGAILTKLDGDARGGAALSFKSVTGKPIKFVGVGEKLTGLESFHPERMANRILGMGDIVSLVEEAHKVVDQQAAKELADKLKAGNRFDLNDFAAQLAQMKKMGGLSSMLDKLPAQFQAAAGQADMTRAEKDMKRMQGIIHSMTPAERSKPDLIKASRKRRIAAGAGVQVQDVNRLLSQFDQMQTMIKKMQKGGMAKMLRGMKGMLPGMR